jgi:formamidopyrimidine-DNA glycosylase
MLLDTILKSIKVYSQIGDMIMPELPEVEVVKTQLNPLVKQTINNVKIEVQKLRTKVDKNLLASLKNETILNLYRRNKYIIMETSHNWIVVHLGMTGQLLLRDIKENSEIVIKHEHITFVLGQHIVVYKDPRKFGLVEVYTKKDYANYLTIPLFESLGYEPLDSTFTLKAFKDIFKKFKKDSVKNVKQFLLDSSYVCGVGNIYASEILFQTGVAPTRTVVSLTNQEKEKMYQIIIDVLKKAISLGGSTISDFKHVNGQSGKMQEAYFVYNQATKPCKICGTKIEKIKQNARTTYFCPSCQK